MNFKCLPQAEVGGCGSLEIEDLTLGFLDPWLLTLGFPWSVGGGPGANVAGSLITIVSQSPSAAAPPQSALMTYAYGAANRFNYNDFYNDRFSLDLSQRLIEFRVKGENHPPNTVALQLYSTSTNGFLQYDLTASDLDGEWRHLSLSLGRFSSYGTNPDLQAIDLVRFRAIGDAGGAALTGSMLVNDLVARSVAEPGGLPLAALALALALLGQAGRRR